MKKIFSFGFILLVNILFSQNQVPVFNLDFEKHFKKDELPNDWIRWGDSELKIDSTNAVSGKNSMLINVKEGEGFGCVAYKLPANFKGKKITLEGFMKYENVSDGFVGLLIRIDKDGQSVGFDNMQNQKLQGTSEWKKHTVTIDFKENADEIYVAGILVGKGKAWFDNFKVSIDGKPIEKQKPVEKELSIIDKDTEFDAGSKFEITNLNEIQKRNLFVLGKVWGFVKYYHPVIAEGKISWDYELFRMLPKINSQNFDGELVQWISKLGTFKTTTQKLPKESIIKLLPNTKWISDTNLISSELSSLLQKINSAERSDKNYYIKLHRSVNNPNFTDEKVYSKMEYSDTGVKLLAVFRYWNMIEYFSPNRHLMDENWDSVLTEFIPRITATKDQKEYTLTLLELIGKIQDTHANIWGYNSVLDAFFGENIAPVKIKFVENKAVVVKLQDEFKDANLQVGDVIVSVNGVKVEDWLNNNLKYFPASNYPTQLRDVARKILRTNDNSIRLTIENNSGVKDVLVSTIKNKYFKEGPVSHKIINENIGYIYPGTLKKGEINEIMDKFLDKKGLIVDLRCYPSDFIIFSLSNYLLNEKKDFVKFTAGDIKTPGLFTFRGGEMQVGGKNKDAFKGKVIILVNEETQSQAEYSAMALRVAPNAKVLGSTTAGADGNVSTIILPGNIFTYISGIGVITPDGSETQRIGIVPDIKMEPTIKGIRSGKDELLEKAIDLINN
ncbi:S41 family peptidase [Flavobacterium proteolyticum]|uniref:Peptidase S41 n=1 Tax=Flavobacterium proteolyticum TaxID=2911683 RepID=A0ABR9WPU3_9FLAO|nr:S41 family peptidase [Flavobacterium proteolyticum]MBE9575907.1 peptidase S41 [Flavobacterium proteolyticum]